MKYAHYDETTTKILGWYDKDIHKTIPKPNIEVTNSVWEKALDVGANAVEGDALIVKDFRTPSEIEEDKLKSIQNAIQSTLDNEAKAKGYDSILSACSYAGHTNPFQAEGQAFVTWRGLVWEHCYQVLADVQAGTIAEPTIEELIASLPTLNLGV